MLAAQLCLTLCNPMDCSSAGYSVHGILQARILEWVAIPFSSGSFRPRDRTQVSCIAGGFFTDWATREAPLKSGFFSYHKENMKNSLWCLGHPLFYTIRYQLFYTIRDVRLILKLLYISIECWHTTDSLNNYFWHFFWEYRGDKDSFLPNFHFLLKCMIILHCFWNLGFPFSHPI